MTVLVAGFIAWSRSYHASVRGVLKLLPDLSTSRSHENGGQHEEVCGDNDEEEEIMEVTPEVDTFFHGGMGNHFLLSSSNDVVNNGEKSEEGKPKLYLVYKTILQRFSLSPKGPY